MIVLGIGIALLSSERVESLALRLVTAELSKAIGAEAKVGSVEYHFPARIAINDIYIEDRQHDTLAYIGEVYAHFSPLALRDKEIRFSHVRVTNVVSKIYQVDSSDEWNYQFLVDAFKKTNTEEMTPPTSVVSVRDIQLRDIRVDYTDYQLCLHDAQMDVHHLVRDSIEAQINRLSFDISSPTKGNERFVLDELRAQFVLSDTTISLPILYAQLPHSTVDLSGVTLDKRTNDYAIDLRNVAINPKDISFFVPQAKNVRPIVRVEGSVRGDMDSVAMRDLLVTFGGRKVGEGSITLRSMQTQPYLRADLTDLSANMGRLQDLVSQISGKPVRFPAELLRLGNIHYRGVAEGHLNDMRLQGAFRTDLGAITTDAKVRSDSTMSQFDYFARVEARKMRLGALLNNNKLGAATLSLETTGTMREGKAQGELRANVHALTYNKYTYQDLFIDGQYSPQRYDGHLRIEDKCMDLAFDGVVNLQERNPEINFTFRCRNFDSSPLLDKGSPSALRTHFNLTAEINGTDMDKMKGYLVLDSLGLATANDSIFMQQLRLFTTAGLKHKTITLQSDYLSGALEGTFRYRDIVPACQALMHYYLPTAVPAPRSSAWRPLAMSMHLEGERLEELQNLFPQPLTIGDQPTIDATMKVTPSTEPNVDVLVQVPNVAMGDLLIHQVTVGLQSLDTVHATSQKGLGLTISAESKDMKVYISSLASNDSIVTNLSIDQQAAEGEYLPEGWREMTPRQLQHALSDDLTFNQQRQTMLSAQRAGAYGGDVQLITCFSQYNNRPLIQNHLLPGTVLLRDSIYTVGESTITYCAADTSVTVDHFRFEGGGQFLEAHGVASPIHSDTLAVNLKKIDASYVVPFILPMQTIMFNGLLTGSAQIAGAFRQPAIEADIHVDSMGLNNCYFGEAEVDLYIYPEREEDGVVAPPQLQFHAEVDRPTRHVVSLDGEAIFDGSGRWKLDMEADSVPLAFINHWTASVLHDLDGHATGDVVVGGKKGSVYVLVNAAAQDASFTLPWTGARYTIPSDTIVLDTTAIRFPNVRTQDENGNKVIVNGNIHHEQFRDFVLDLHVDAYNALVFDQDKQGEMLQGKVYANGHVDVTGHEDDILVSANAVTTGKSHFRLSVDNVSSANESNFIHFVNHADSVRSSETETDEPTIATKDSVFVNKKQRCVLALNIEVNPQLLFKLVFGERNGDMIQAHGSGALRLTYDTQADDVRLLGTYDIEQGTLSYTVANVIRKEFVVGEGSHINFSGDPNNPQLDVTAKYRVTASLKDLLGEEIEQLATTRTSIPVLTCLHMRNTLNDPLLNFSLEFPASDQAIQQQIRQVINTDEMLMRQVIYLLVFGRFFTPDYMAQSQYMTLNSTYSLLSSTVTSQINAWLSKLTDMLTLGVAIRTDGEGASASQEYEAQFQLQPVDRLVINGNVGYRYNDISNQPFFGDLDVEVLLTEDGQFRLKGYTHTVDKYSLREASTIQGVGFVWKKDFNWPTANKNKNKQQPPTTTSDTIATDSITNNTKK